MKDSLYAKACTEVLEILSHFSEDDFSKIPEDKIEFLRQNSDKDYNYKIDPEIDLSEQYISDEANAIIIGLYREYFATEHQRIVLDDVLRHNQVLQDRENRRKYNPDNIFSDNKQEKENQISNNSIETYSEVKEEIFEEKVQEKNEVQMIEYKESFFTKFKNFILRLLHIKE